MGGAIKKREIERGGYKYYIKYLAGFPHGMQKNQIILDYGTIVAANIEPVKVETIKKYGGQKNFTSYRLATYDTKPDIIIFHTKYSKSFSDNLKLFEDKFKEKLNSKYCIGIFSHYSSGFASVDELYLEGEKAFCVAVFEKDEEDILDFVIDFLLASGIRGADITGPRFAADIVDILRNNYYKDE